MLTKSMSLRPAPMTMMFESPISGNTTEVIYLDLWQCIATLQRRSARQGRVLAVAGIRFCSDKQLTIDVSTLPNTWVTAEAWSATFDAWSKLNRQALAETDDSARARYLDFKVYMDLNHSEAVRNPSAGNYTLLPAGVTFGTGSSDTAYEWDYSKIQFPEDSSVGAVGYPLHMVGENDFSGNESLGVIHNYAISRARPQDHDPNMPVDDLGALGGSYLTTMFDTGSNLQTVAANVVGENNEPPYPVGLETNAAGSPTGEFYPGGANYLGSVDYWKVAKFAVYSAAASASYGNGFCPGFLAPLGLVKLTIDNVEEGAADLEFFVDLVPGEGPNGILSQSMKEMNG